MMKSKKTRVAVIGAGGWGYQHARAFSNREDTELCCIVGRTLERTRARAEQFKVNYYLDIDTMLEQEKPDLVSICMPGQGTFEPTMKVIKAGFPLFVEKPLAYSLDEARIMIEEARKRDLFFAIDFNHSCSEPVQRAKQIIDSGQLGSIVFAQWRFAQSSDGIPITHPYMEQIEAQCHGLDLIEYLCGPIESLSADMTDIAGKNSYTTFSLSLHFKNQGVGTFLGSFDSSECYEFAQMIDVNGMKGRILIEDNLKRCTYQKAGSQVAETWRPSMFDDDANSFTHNLDRHLDRLIPAFRSGGRPPIPAERGLRALQLAYAAIESFQTGKRITIE